MGGAMLSGPSLSLCRMWKRLAGLVLCVAIGLTACGGEDPPSDKAGAGSRFGGPFADAKAYPVFASTEIVVGTNRFLVGLLDDNDAPIGSADIDMHIEFYDRARSETEPVFGADMEFIETIPGERGLYMTTADFDSAGKWGAEVTVTGDGLDETVNAAFDVAPKGTTPAIGAPAPASDTLTARDADDLSAISTDTHPDPDFYRVSIKDALARGQAFVVVFATPKYCESRTCGPTVETVDAVRRDLISSPVRWIHVEIYEDNDPAKGTNEWVKQWNLPSEPWVFVVDEQGVIRAKFEGAVSKDELEQAVRSHLL